MEKRALKDTLDESWGVHFLTTRNCFAPGGTARPDSVD
jgi:hypothetical protein